MEQVEALQQKLHDSGIAKRTNEIKVELGLEEYFEPKSDVFKVESIKKESIDENEDGEIFEESDDEFAEPNVKIPRLM